MANQQNSYTGSDIDANNELHFTFPSYTTSEVKVEVDNVVKTLTTHYTVENYTPSSGGKVKFTTGNVPSDTAAVRIFRQTDVDNPKATFTAGSSLKAAEINENFKQLRHALQETIGATYDNSGNLTSRQVQTFNIEDGAITSAKIKDDSIVNADIKSDAAIDGAKIDPSFNQRIITSSYINASGNISSNGTVSSSDISLSTNPRTIKALNGKLILDSSQGDVEVDDRLDVNDNLNVDGTTTLNGTTIDGVLDVNGSATIDNVQINGNEIDTTSGNLTIDSAGGTITVDDNLSVSGDVDLSDDAKIKIGSSNFGDLQLYHQASGESFIAELGTGNLNIAANHLKIASTVGTLKLETTASAVNIPVNLDVDGVTSLDNTTVDGTFSVTGNVTLGDSTSDTVAINGLVNSHLLPAAGADRLIGMETIRWSKVYADEVYTDAIRLDDATGKIQIGFNPDLELYHNNTDGYIDNNKGHLYIRNNVNDDDGGDIYIQPKAGENGILIADDASVLLYTDNVLRFATGASYNINAADLVPDSDNDKDLGISALKWQNIWVNNIQGGALVTSGTSTSDVKSYSAKRSDELYYRKGTADDIEASGVPWSGNDSTVATTAAIDKRIVDIVDDIGGFVPLTDEGEIPQLHPEYQNTDTADRVGTILSIGVIAKSGGYNPSGGTVTIGASELTNHSVDVTITNCGTTELEEGYGVLVETTAQTDAQYAAGPEFKFHRLVPKATEVTTVAGAQPAITNVSNNLTNGVITNVNNNLTSGANISNVNSNMSIISTVNTNIGNNVLPNINNNLTSGANISNVNSNINTISNVNSNINTISNVNTQINNGNIAAVAGKATEMGVLAASDVVADMAILGASGVVGNIATVAGQISPTNNINTVATNIANVNNFAATYQIASSAPSTDGAGNALAAGDLYFDTSANELRVYNGSTFQGGVTATGNLAGTGANTFTGDQTIQSDLIISSALPIIYLTDTGNNPDWSIKNGNGDFNIKDETAGSNRLTINSSGNVQIPDDSGKIQLGSSQDLQIYHDGTDSIIDNNTGNLNLVCDSAQAINLRHGSENMIRAITDGAVELYFDNSKKFRTYSDGVIGDQNIWVGSDNYKLLVGGSADLKIYHDSTNSLIDNDTGSLYINSADSIFIAPNNDEAGVYVRHNDAVELYFDNSKKLETNSTGVAVTGDINLTANIDMVDSTSGSVGRIRLGTDDDFQLYHDGNHNIIKGVQSLLLKKDDAESYIRCIADAQVELHYDGAKQCETNSGGMNWADGKRAYFGNSSDLQIYHNGSDSLISNTTGELQISNNGSAVFLQSTAGENALKLTVGKAVELYYDNSKKFETTSTGVTVTGHLATTGNVKLGDSSGGGNNRLTFGASDDLQIWHDGSHSHIADEGTGRLKLAGSAVQITNAAITETMLYAVEDGAVELYYDHSKKLETVSGGINVVGTVTDDGANHDGDVNFYGVSSYNAQWDKSDASLKLLDNAKIKIGSGGDLQIYHDGTNSHIHDDTSAVLQLTNNDIRLKTSGDETMIRCIANDSVNLMFDGTTKAQTFGDGFKVTSGGELYIDGNAASGHCQLVMTRSDYSWMITNQTNLRFYKQSGNNGNPDTKVAEFNTSGHFVPGANNTYDLGSSSLRWANVYTNDLHLSNVGHTNDVDGTWGDWTIQEGESDLFLKNNRSGKKYKFNLTEVS